MQIIISSQVGGHPQPAVATLPNASEPSQATGQHMHALAGCYAAA